MMKHVCFSLIVLLPLLFISIGKHGPFVMLSPRAVPVCNHFWPQRTQSSAESAENFSKFCLYVTDVPKSATFALFAAPWRPLRATPISQLATLRRSPFGHGSPKESSRTPLPPDTILYPNEKHFKNVRQLTFGGDNAEAYWSYDNKYIVFQRTNAKEGLMCDQIFVGKVPQKPGDKFEYKMISTGKGRCTCPFFTRDGKHIIYASTHLGADTCPPLVDRSKYGNKYIWPLYDSYDIFMADLDGKIVKQLTQSKGYDAEATLSPDGKKMIYTSDKDGDIDLYVMDLKSGKEKKFTNTLGYDGGAWFSPDGKKIIWRASRPKTDEEIKDYKDLLAQNLVAPLNMEVFVANIDGSNVRQVTHFGQANWAPAFFHDSKRIIFASNHKYKRGFPFDLYMINEDGSGLSQVSHSNTFDAFPMFSPDGKKIVWCSNRNNGGTHETNVFVADWEE